MLVESLPSFGTIAGVAFRNCTPVRLWRRRQSCASSNRLGPAGCAPGRHAPAPRVGRADPDGAAHVPIIIMVIISFRLLLAPPNWASDCAATRPAIVESEAAASR